MRRAGTRCPFARAGSRWPTSPRASCSRPVSSRRSSARARPARASSSTSRSSLPRSPCSSRISSGSRARRMRRASFWRTARTSTRGPTRSPAGVAMNPYYRCFEASDGFVAVACLNLAQREAFLGLFGLEDATVDAPDLVPDDPVVLAAKEELTAAGRARLRRAPGRRVARACSSPQACRAGRCSQRETVYADPQVVAERLVAEVEQPGLGPIELLAPFVRVGGEPPSAAPRPGARRRHRRRPRGAPMTFDVPAEHALFAESVRTAIGDWEPPREPELGDWQDDRDDALADAARQRRLERAVGGRGAARRRRRRRDRARTRRRPGQPPRRGHARRPALGRGSCAARVEAPARWPFLAAAAASRSPRRRPKAGPSRRSTGAARSSSNWPRRASSSPLLRLRAGARGTRRRSRTSRGSRRERSSSRSSTHARGSSSARRSRRFPPCSPGSPTPRSRRTRSRCSRGRRRRATPALRTASCAGPGSACCDVTASAQQVHGAVGFALETGLHVYYRRARAVSAWGVAVCDALR